MGQDGGEVGQSCFVRVLPEEERAAQFVGVDVVIVLQAFGAGLEDLVDVGQLVAGSGGSRRGPDGGS